MAIIAAGQSQHSMRALILVFVAVSALLVVRCMVPGSSEAADTPPSLEAVEAEESDVSAPPGSDARFLTPPSEPRERSVAPSASSAPEPQVPPPATEPAVQQPVPAATPPAAAPERPAWLADFQPSPRTDPGELAIAAALVHGDEITPVAGENEWRFQVAECFAAALSGDSSRALELAAKLPEKEVGEAERAQLQAALTGKPRRHRLRNPAMT